MSLIPNDLITRYLVAKALATQASPLMHYQAPFPYFGGKSRAAPLIWQALGEVRNYVEPFAGSLAVLLGRPHAPGIETVNDKCGYLCNFWRALQAEPEAVAHYADQPVNECDLHARHTYLVRHGEQLTARLMGEPDYYDPLIAGYWVYGMACWIGRGFCSGKGPWHVLDGHLVEVKNAGPGVWKQQMHLGNAGQGIHRQRVHLGDAGQGVKRQRVHLGSAGQGIHRKLVHDADGSKCAGTGEAGLLAWMQALAERLARVRVCCGDWTRVLGPSATTKVGLTGVLLDPPYLQTERDANLYRVEDNISAAVRDWALAHGDDPKMRIALCGYDGEHDMPDTWRGVPWKAQGGMGNQAKTRLNANKHRERLWFSPHCLEVTV